MQQKGFFGKLFDFSFQHFITPTIIAVLYVLAIIFAVAASVAFIVAGFNIRTSIGIVFVILSPIVFLLYTIIFRVVLESMVALVRIAQNTTDLLEK